MIAKDFESQQTLKNLRDHEGPLTRARNGPAAAIGTPGAYRSERNTSRNFRGLFFLECV